MISNDFYSTCEKAHIKIKFLNNSVLIKHKMNFKSNIASILFFIGGINLILIPILKNNSEHSINSKIILGVIFIIFSLIYFIQLSRTKLFLDQKGLCFVSNFQKEKFIPMNDLQSIKMETTISKTRNSRLITTTLYAYKSDKKEVLFNFVMNDSQNQEAIHLGCELKQIINNYINQNKSINSSFDNDFKMDSSV